MIFCQVDTDSVGVVKRALDDFDILFLSNVRNFIDQNETKLETNKSEYTDMYI
jgi:hypothetical protein